MVIQVIFPVPFANSAIWYATLIKALVRALYACCFSLYGHSQGRNLRCGGGVYSYIRVMSDEFLLKSAQIQKKSVGQNMNI